VGNDSASGGKSGVSVINTRTLDLLASLKTGGGHHELAFTPDGKYVLVTNESDGTLTLIDAGSMKIVRSEKTGQLPVGVAVSPDGRLAFVANGGNGTINIFSLPDLNLETSLNVEPGLTGMHLSPDGRWAFVLNPNRNQIYIIDTTKSELRHTLEIAGAPDQVAFSQQNAYIRPLNGTSLMSMALSSLEGELAPAMTEIPYAQRPPGQSMEQALANPVATMPDEGAVLIANPADNLIYYLLEGTLAPAGSYQDQATLPRAVRFVDRSLRQEAPGIYSGKVRIPAGGDYQVALLLDSPRLVHCFNFTAKPGTDEASQGAGLQVEYVDAPSQVKADQPFKLQLRASDPSTGQPVVDLADLVLLASQTGGNWNQRYLASAMGDGLYEVALSLPQPGRYQILLSASSRGAGLGDLPRLSLQVSR
jgi:YVTN family beta-propeller protein